MFKDHKGRNVGLAFPCILKDLTISFKCILSYFSNLDIKRRFKLLFSIISTQKATMVKQRKIRYRKTFPCSICNFDCEGQESVLCFECGKWVHSTCTEPNLTQELHGRWSARGLKFYCQLCCFSGDQFDFQHSLLR
jgi:hypothetical protein